MARYGSHPLDLTKYLKLEEEDTRDWSIDILLGLATAYLSAMKLEERHPTSTLLNKKQLILSSIEKAWRETLFIRASLPSSSLTDVERPVIISKFGVIYEKNDENSSRRSGNEGDAGRAPDKGNISRKRGARLSRRRVYRT